MKDKILLIGGNGYLGNHLKKVIDSHFDAWVTGTSPKNKPNYYQVDYNDCLTFQSLKGCHFEIIILLASSMDGLGQTNLNNSCLNINTVNYASFLQFIADERLTKKVIYISSMTVYGYQKNLPANEMGLISPLSTYGLSKQLAENITMFFAEQNRIKALILRLPGIYGGTRKEGYIFNTVINACKNETITINTKGLGYWECIEINDLCNIIKQLLITYNWTESSKTLNIGYGELTDFVDTAKFIIKAVNSSSNLVIENEKGYQNFYMDNREVLKFVDFNYRYYISLQKYINNVMLS